MFMRYSFIFQRLLHKHPTLSHENGARRVHSNLNPPDHEQYVQIQKPVFIKVYLQGSFPAEFKRLQIETNQLLEELQEIPLGKPDPSEASARL